MKSARSAFLLSICSLSLSSLGCSSSDTKATPGPQKAGDADSGSTYLGLETPTDGFQVRSTGTTISAGGDEEYCEIAELPGDPSKTYYVKGVELGNGDHSHHLIVTAAIPGGVAEKKLQAMNVGDKIPCLSGQQAFGEAGQDTVHGIQQHYGRIDYTKGVGRVYHGGQRIVFDYHYANTTTKEVHAESAINFHLTTEDEVEHIADGFGFYNWTIDTKAHDKGSFTAECAFKNDVMVQGITRHTHKWGTDYSVWYKGGPDDGAHLWTSTDWQNDVDHMYAEPRLMKKGEGFKFQCNYDNTEDHDLRFGTNASDEMCILFGLVWNAGPEKTVPAQGCNITWTDADGVGHSPTSPDFPKPSADETALCLAGSAQGDAPLDACSECRCNSCAAPVIGCATDTECKAVLDCFSSGPSCDQQTIIDQHSSALGLLQQLLGCVQVKCPACDPPADAGTK